MPRNPSRINLPRTSRRNRLLETLEPRTLLSIAHHNFVSPLLHPFVTGGESVTAQLNLLSTSGSPGSQTFQYQIVLHNTGSTTIGTFWFSWVPGEDFLPTPPLSVTSPTNWHSTLTGENSVSNGTAIQWVADAPGAFLQPGSSLDTFVFTSHDTLTQLGGKSPTHSTFPVLTSFVYSGAPLADAGAQFLVTGGTTASTVATTTSLKSSAPSVNAGTSLTFTATVTPASPGTPPTGTVLFLDGPNSIGTATLKSDGTATLTTSALAVGSHSLIATYNGDSSYTGSSSALLTQTILPAPATATHLFIASKLLPAQAGHTLGPIVVNLLDAKNHLDATNNSNVTISLFNSTAALAGTLTVAAHNGVATFSDLSITKTGTYSFAATDASLSAPKSKPFTITADAASAHLVLITHPLSTGTVGVPLLPLVSAEIQDQFGNLAVNDHSALALSIASGPVGGRLAGHTTANAKKGLATFKSLIIPVAGTYTINISDASLAIPTPVTFNETIDPATTLLPAPAVAASYSSLKPIKLTTTLTSSAPKTVPFTASATLTDQHNTLLGSATPTSNGQLKFTLSPLAAGTYIATVHYPADSGHTSATSAPFTLLVI